MPRNELKALEYMRDTLATPSAEIKELWWTLAPKIARDMDHEDNRHNDYDNGTGHNSNHYQPNNHYTNDPIFLNI